LFPSRNWRTGGPSAPPVRKKETEALRRIEHAGIVRLIDAGWISEYEPYLVMSYVQGPTLRALLQAGPIARQVAAKWLLELGEALGETHARGVLHLDLKPENVMIQDFQRPEERVIIVDFGAAAMLNAVRSGGSLMLGSFNYLALEQVQGRSLPVSDVDALTAITFEMLTGVPSERPADIASFTRELSRALILGLRSA
jgi:serine/threonine protein kinase